MIRVKFNFLFSKSQIFISHLNAFIFAATLEPTYRQLQAMRLDKSPFVITSVVGQELLATGNHAAAVVVLESALRIGTCSLKLRGSVFSALSSAYWALNTLDRAIAYMQQDLAVAKSLGILLLILYSNFILAYSSIIVLLRFSCFLNSYNTQFILGKGVLFISKIAPLFESSIEQ